MEQAEERDEHGAPGSDHGIHDPEGEQYDQRVERRALPGVLPLSAAGAKQPNQHHESQLIVQGRGHHGGEDAEQEQQDFRPWIQPESLPWGCSAVHAVIPAFSNCFFSILPPIHPLKAAMTSVPTTMTASNQEGAEALMV